MSIGIWVRSCRLATAGLLLFAVHSASAQLDATLVRAQELIDAGNAQAAYELLAPEADRRAAEFEAVKRLDPPPEVQATIDRYLAELDRRQGREQQTFVRGYLAATVGYDSNVNSAQDANQLNVPLFASLSPTGDGTTRIGLGGVEKSDTFGASDRRWP
jgi:hypothetical protein